MIMRKGQRVCNYIQRKGLKNEDVHQVLFYMDDDEFGEVGTIISPNPSEFAPMPPELVGT